jgi:hypothetical protein
VKLILSRKGFDSTAAYGACASPILPDGQMISLPIPHSAGTVTFDALRPRGVDLGHLVSDLSGRRGLARESAHLDPDLDATARPRRAGWCPAFGQASTAQRHLDGNRVGVGDLFLFFGWFRKVTFTNGRYAYHPKAPDLHVLFGWLRVGKVLRLDTDRVPGWLADHPHVGRDWPHNTLYAAEGRDGGGVFSRFEERLRLTEKGNPRRSVWRLPADFAPGSRPSLTYHGKASRWTDVEGGCCLQSVAKGQEFVLDLDLYPGVRRWTESILL